MPDISEILLLPEGRTLEFKQDLSSLKPIMKSLIAFANTAGGTLIIGKHDDGDVRLGIERRKAARPAPVLVARLQKTFQSLTRMNLLLEN